MQAIENLMYKIIGISPDILFTVDGLSQLIEKVTVGRWTCVERVFRYKKRFSTHESIFIGQRS